MRGESKSAAATWQKLSAFGTVSIGFKYRSGALRTEDKPSSFIFVTDAAEHPSLPDSSAVRVEPLLLFRKFVEESLGRAVPNRDWRFQDLPAPALHAVVVDTHGHMSCVQADADALRQTELIPSFIADPEALRGAFPDPRHARLSHCRCTLVIDRTGKPREVNP